ncbi:MAG TPA: chitobiase/beta-hexosaminidase C-terminal domain-containing protein [Terracidiphilus sp.]
MPSAATAQSFAPIAPLSFTKTFGGGDPLPQMIMVASTGTNFNFGVTATTTTGGTWLTVTPSAYGCCTPTPGAVTVNVNPLVTLAAGTYTGQILIKGTTGTASITVPVTLTIEAATSTYFDQVAGGLTFTMQTNTGQPPSQALQIRNAGAGTLAWTATGSTSDGGAWLVLSAASGTAPSTLSVGVNVQKLPGLGLTAGTFVGQVLLKTTGDSVTVPITVSVGDSVMRQVNPLSFNKVYGGNNPLPQVITVASTGSNFDINAVALSSTGGSWLSVTPSAYGCCTLTPQTITVAVNPAVTLAAGTYMAEVVVKSNTINQGLSIPVTLTVNANTATFFDDTPGALNFSMETAGTTPSAQIIQVNNAGVGTLAWTAAATTADGGAWLKLSAASGNAPAVLTASVVPASLPTAGLAAGVFVGQILLRSGDKAVTVPVSFTVGAAVFREVGGLNFTKTYGGANPLPQVVTIASTGANFDFNAVTSNSTGGSWLTITPSSYGCCTPTPYQVTVTVNPAVTLAAGTYSAQIIAKSNDGGQVLAIPVTLTIMPATAAFFDALPGQLSFAMVTKGNTPPPQPLEIRNAGTGALSWTASFSTTDGGSWLAVSPTTGVAPGVASVSVIPANLPGKGLIAGTFSGQVTLQSSTNRVTIPVTFAVADSVFRQINALDFTKTYGGPNPLPQVITAASTGADFDFSAVAVNSTGGAWLSITPSSYGCCTPTPRVITVSVAPAVTLAAGTYTAEIILKSNSGSPSVVVPVTLNVSAATTPHFDDVPGGINFFQATSGAAPAAKSFTVRNASTGLLNWTASVTTSDGAGWLAISAAKGTAPTNLTVSVNPAALPGQGLTAGYFSGQIVLQTAGDRETIPITYVVGAAVFASIPPVNFSKAFGAVNPGAQVINVSSLGTNFAFAGLAASSNGGAWLQITPSAYGCCTSTPLAVTVTPVSSTTQAAGTYVGEIIFTSDAGGQVQVVPVNLTINSATATATPVISPAAGTYTTAQQVTITDATPDAAIYYTNNGTTPTTASTIYSGPIAVSATTTIKAIAVAPAFGSSAVASATFTINQNAAAPVISPAAGTYTTVQTVSMTSSTTGAVLYYTLDGTTPTTASTRYAAPFSVAKTETVKAIATATGYLASAVTTAAYTINLPTAATPTFSPAAGAYTGTQNVTITSTTTGAAIYYTVDGTTPTTASTKYTTPVSVAKTETVKAIATATNYNPSAVASAAYTLTAVTPTFSPAAGTYTTVQTVTISDATAGAIIYYTVDGSTPTTASTKYTAPISVTKTETIKAIATATGLTNSAVASAAYTLNLTAATPTFSPAGGTYTTTQAVTISDATSGAVIYYTVDGSTPTTASAKYTAPLNVTKTETIKAIATATGYSNSAVATATYTINTVLATPTFSVAAGTYPAVRLVGINSTGTGVTIYYTVDGTTPTTASAKYTTPIVVSKSETIKALATATGFTNSAVASAAYVIIGSPTALASPATAIATPAATLNAIVNSQGLAGSYYFQYGITATTLTTNTVGTSLPAATTAVNGAAVLSGLTTKTTYYFRVVVTTAGGTATGAVLSFTTN